MGTYNGHWVMEVTHVTSKNSSLRDVYWLA